MNLFIGEVRDRKGGLHQIITTNLASLSWNTLSKSSLKGRQYAIQSTPTKMSMHIGQVDVNYHFCIIACSPKEAEKMIRYYCKQNCMFVFISSSYYLSPIVKRKGSKCFLKTYKPNIVAVYQEDETSDESETLQMIL